MSDNEVPQHIRQGFELARNSFLAYIKLMFPPFQCGPHHLYLATILEKVASGEIKRLIISMPPRHTKLCADHTPVLTAEGWSTHGELQVGDHVYHPSGRLTKVVALSEKNEANYKITFSDGSEIYCNGGHLWTVFNRSASEWQTKTTEELGQRTVWSAGRGVFQLPRQLALQGKNLVLPLHPYALGAWLGDGSTTKSCITHAAEDEAVVEKIERLGYPRSTVHVHSVTGVHTTSFGGSRGKGKQGAFFTGLQNVGVLGNKHIPEAYQQASMEQRLELLAGLIDTDGHVDKASGRVRFITTLPSLALGVMELARGLGFYPYLSQQDQVPNGTHIQGKLRFYVVGFQPDQTLPVALERKKVERFAQRRRVSIRSIEKDDQGYRGNCIQVDAEDGLYLVGRNLVPTHNSLMTTEMLPPWLLGLDPSLQIISVSYGQDLANTFGRKVRQQVLSPLYRGIFPDTVVDERSAAVERFETSKRGAYNAAGVGGALLGKGGNVIIIDDPYKNYEESISPAKQQEVVEFYQSVLETRQQPSVSDFGGAAIIIIHQRWNDNDLTAWVLENRAHEDWIHIMLKAVAEPGENDPLGRSPGEVLWPGAFDEDFMNNMKANNPYRWAAMYQQEPVPLEGNIFKTAWFSERWTTAPALPIRVLSYDTAGKLKAHNDPTAGGEWAVDPNTKRIYLANAWAEKMEYADLKNRIRQEIKDKQPYRVLIEDRNSGQGLCQELAMEFGMLIEPVQPEFDKQTRAVISSSTPCSGQVILPKNAPWLAEYERQLFRFPYAKKDDYVDMSSQAWTWIRANLFGQGTIRAGGKNYGAVGNPDFHQTISAVTTLKRFTNGQ